MNKFYLLLLPLVIAGCSSKETSALKFFEKDPQSANAIQYTQKGDITYKNEIHTMLFATYLNNSNKKYESKKLNSFLVGVHLANRNNHDFKEKGYTLTLNGKEPVSIKDINTDSDLVKSIPLKNSWGKYYLIQFENEEKIKNLNLSLLHPEFGQVLLKFQK